MTDPLQQILQLITQELANNHNPKLTNDPTEQRYLYTKLTQQTHDNHNPNKTRTKTIAILHINPHHPTQLQIKAYTSWQKPLTTIEITNPNSIEQATKWLQTQTKKPYLNPKTDQPSPKTQKTEKQ